MGHVLCLSLYSVVYVLYAFLATLCCLAIPHTVLSSCMYLSIVYHTTLISTSAFVYYTYNGYVYC